MAKVKMKQRHIRHLPKNNVAEAFGWIGAAAILIDYALLSLGLIGSNSLAYHFIFMIGSAGLAIITFRHRAFQSFTVNALFMLLALVALARITFFA